LVFDRGFNEPAARAFLKTYDDTIAFAGLKDGDNISSSLEEETTDGASAETTEAATSAAKAIPRIVVDARSPKRSTLALPEGVIAVEMPAAPLSKSSHAKLAKWLELIVEFAEIESETGVPISSSAS
jgi:hypothetical protein